MVTDMAGLAASIVRAAVVVLAVVGVAHGQVPQEDARQRTPRRQAQPVEEPGDRPPVLDGPSIADEQGEQPVEESGDRPPGIGRRIADGLAEIFTGGRLRAHVNGAYQHSPRRSEIEKTFQAYGERARLLTRQEFRGGGHVDVGGTLRVWRRLALGASYTQVAGSGNAVVTGTVPHPLDTGRDRTARQQALSLPQRQRATHVHLAWGLPLRDALDVELSAGPTYFSLRQGVVVNLTPIEVGGPPFSEVGLRVDAGEHTRNGIGYHAGVDVSLMLTQATRFPQVGIGYFARVTGGQVSVPLDAETWRRVSVGGFQTGVGLRLRF